MWGKITDNLKVLWDAYRAWIVAQVMTIGVCLVLCVYMQGHQTIPDQTEGNDSQRTEWTSEITNAKTKATTEKEDQVVNTTGAWFVDVKGAVKRPGIYQIQGGKRVIDAITLAGGLRGDANLQQINQATKVSDEMVIDVPVKGDQTSESAQTQSTHGTDAKNTLVNINKATEAELMTLPGVGQKRAQDILAYREEKHFASVDDLGQVQGIGPKMLAKLTPLVCV
ncbi:helix-hairpin-helix domain-containing protein [Weissella tructae]|uniref:Late competence protein required for DNA binding and uptake n=2 Tax=Weissella TaxID=46255 RepID=A0A075U5E4_9LACO|nr:MULTISPECIES: helix-hairpin-helix domain-containing protein [Weissella]AIG65347.1 Late competence protein required for DNA binding and uptake [Weissella tructae]AIM62661.1 Late competence protein required for DNA binding and uptake [Weissella ceti]AIM63996.1 Late competence protein required for DNA binding and uptake [Weissella ceti]ELA07193.1 competence protein CelA [Weissella ceti NC36]QVV91728.1 helix-hairpin-helix domain-containing protein [Weissella tructae]